MGVSPYAADAWRQQAIPFRHNNLHHTQHWYYTRFH